MQSPSTPWYQRPASRLGEGGLTLILLTREGELPLYGRGVSDLYRVLTQSPHLLHGSWVVDTVVGKGAAALMILGGVERLYTPLISHSALALLEKSSVEVVYEECVERIMNRTQTDQCPVEKRCMKCRTAEECLTEIEAFINSK